MELEHAIKTRRSIRKYQDREVPTDLIMKAIELATWAPNNAGQQSWKYYVVKSREMIDRIADAVQAKIDLMASWPETASMEKMKHHQTKGAFFRSAAALVITGAGPYEGVPDIAPRLRGMADPVAREIVENRTAVNSRAQAMGAATAQMLLGFHSLGLGACWLGGPMIARREIAEMLGVPGGIELFALIAVGYPAEEPEPAPRRSMEEVVRVY